MAYPGEPGVHFFRGHTRGFGFREGGRGVELWRGGMLVESDALLGTFGCEPADFSGSFGGKTSR
jgi:hypothetical protein